MVVLPAAGFSVLSTMYFFGAMVLSWAETLTTQISKILTVGFSWQGFNFDFFYVNTDILVFVSLIAVLGTFLIIATSRGLAEEKNKFGLDSVLFLCFTLSSPPSGCPAPFIMSFSLRKQNGDELEKICVYICDYGGYFHNRDFGQ